MKLIESKIYSTVILAVTSLFVGVLPNCFARHGRSQWPLLLSNLLCFGGGVLLSTSLVHILPELRESVPYEYKVYAEIIYCLGFFLIYLIDEFVHYVYGDSEEVNILHNHGHRHRLATTRRHSDSVNRDEWQPLLRNENNSPYNPSFYKARSDSVLFCEEAPSQLCHVGHREPCNAAPTANLGLIAALSVHALLEGLVVGLETKPEKVLLLLGAIASHKLVISFCLGIELSSASSISNLKHFCYIFIFSVGSAAGILIGMFISNIPGSVREIVIPILQGLAGGTLLYVTVSEVLPRERARWHQQHERKSAGIFQFCSVFVGFVLMTILSHYLDYDE
ncbi:protein zntD [Diorhabda sublineata]|uniref:protein zntD n=1 Tax=Diorhabda sublineata TaxID=1163346 RepID=UPI0024E18635|nr:protein zntD [Diorhabda sublineata]